MNDRDDFLPAVRNAAWWSGDSRMAANGRAVEAILIKQGKHEREDISDLEPVRMGHIMQPLIGRLAQDKLGIELKDADYALTHSKESWLKSHFDFISTDGTTLVEAKTYRFSGHSRADQGLYRPEGELAMWEKRDPILLTEQALTKKGLLDEAMIEQLKAKAAEIVDAAIIQAQNDPEPTVKDMFSNIYSSQKVG